MYKRDLFKLCTMIMIHHLYNVKEKFIDRVKFLIEVN